MRIRAFLAIDCKQDVQKKLISLAELLKNRSNGFRWVKEENLHMTLRFLGEVEESKIAHMELGLRQALQEFESFPIIFSGFRGFPNLSHCRVLWVDVIEGADSCRQLKKVIDESLVSFGFPKETEEFVPHMTLARLKFPQNVSLLMPVSSPKVITMVESLVCFKSELTSSGPNYHSLFKVFLKDRS
ncbi:MAG: RNA 2',3'-cyclic phosphodiesterase [Candidatus Omnitrophica bacterium]|nr:RNA 2',3'-cyclic phosphodiesterase [Candidatus Omnitrophota bacterium]